MTPQPDFLHPVRGPHRLAWLACGTALLVLAMAALDAGQAWSAREAAQGQLAAPLAGNGVKPQTKPVAALTPAQQQTRQSLQKASSSLDRPWPQVFYALENINTNGLAWLALNVAETGALRLEGQSTETQAVMDAAASMRGEPALREVLAARIDNAQGGVLRFEISAVAASFSSEAKP
jgi:hypothetical protein